MLNAVPANIEYMEICFYLNNERKISPALCLYTFFISFYVRNTYLLLKYVIKILIKFILKKQGFLYSLIKRLFPLD